MGFQPDTALRQINNLKGYFPLRWQPLPHHDLLQLVENTLPRYGMSVIEQAHAITHDGLRYFGLLQIANGSQHPD